MKIQQLFFLLLFVSHFTLHAQTTQVDGTVYLNLSQANITGQSIDIPVTFTSTDPIVGLDLALKFNENALRYDSLVSKASYLTNVYGHFSQDNRTLKATCNSFQNLLVNQNIFAIRFKMLTNTVLASDLYELVGYLNGERVAMELKGNFPFRQSALKFWSDNAPIPYDVNDPGRYLITTILGVDSDCRPTTATAVQPDLSGHFSFNSNNGDFLKIQRDILSLTNVQPVINAADLNLANKIVLSDAHFIPNIYQLIALDVNADGVISAGDLSQLHQRSTGILTEFKQKWNFQTLGNPSKDWLFVDSALLAIPRYTVSSTYPLNDGAGCSKANVPVVPFCLQAPTSPTPVSIYTGIMLGDLDGNYSTIPNDGKIKKRHLLTKKNRRV